MDCPKCGFGLDDGAAECPRCGIIIARFLRAQAERVSRIPPTPGTAHDIAIAAEATGAEDAARRERIARGVALPGALLFAWLAVKGSPGAVRMLSMWVHESGHAVTAWVCGYTAWPGPWFTPVSSERSPSFTVLLLGLLGYGAYRAWQIQRWFWIAAAAVGILLVLSGTLLLSSNTAQQLVIFGGDGGCLVLGTMLMCTVYAREDHPVRRNQLRWGLLVIGALAFMDVYHVWSGPIGELPFGENENGLSDPSVLTELHGWNVVALISRYVQLAHVCLGLLVVVYVASLYVQTVNFRASAGARPAPA